MKWYYWVEFILYFFSETVSGRAKRPTTTASSSNHTQDTAYDMYKQHVATIKPLLLHSLIGKILDYEVPGLVLPLLATIVMQEKLVHLKMTKNGWTLWYCIRAPTHVVLSSKIKWSFHGIFR